MLSKYDRVRYELLRPAQVRARREDCPVVYVPVGALEWHSFHNPLGLDALKAHAICCEAALRTGGVVMPPVFQGMHANPGWGPHGWENYTLGYFDHELLYQLYESIMRNLVVAGYRVLVGVTGHNTAPQLEALQRAIRTTTASTAADGFAVFDCGLQPVDDDLVYRGDHAAAWETSVMMYIYPDTVALEELLKQGEPLADNWDPDGPLSQTPLGIKGYNPVTHASAELGKQIVEKMGRLLGAEALRILGTVLPDRAETGT